MPFLFCPMALVESILIDVGSANQRYRFALLQDSAKPPVWDRGYGLHSRLCVCSSSAPSKHRESWEFCDCMKGRIRFMTAITSAYAHAYQATCLTRHMSAVLHRNFRLPKPKARYPHLRNGRTTTRERGHDFQGWAICRRGYSRCGWLKP